jgi:hypothetical protein
VDTCAGNQRPARPRPAWRLLFYVVAGGALSPPYPIVAGGLGAMGAVVLVGAPAGERETAA